jgi:hypothetical protein
MCLAIFVDCYLVLTVEQQMEFFSVIELLVLQVDVRASEFFMCAALQVGEGRNIQTS